MTDNMKLVFPTMEYKEKAVQFINEFYENGSEINGSGALDFYLSDFTYEEWLQKLQKDIDMANIAPGRVPALTYFYVREEDDCIVGMINLRLTLNDFQRNEGGHIGYCVRPTERRKHYATMMLKDALEVYKLLSVSSVLISCDTTNVGSQNTIKNNGGRLIREFYSETFKVDAQMYSIDLE